ncbi:MAPK/MAK/MRK overlapping kinase-like [Saccoglossus kowalevskii]|uniref:MAPK/MAK/MRK overlapping kinase-like n=1 Tax=Saccoglossus kowalevskii TaxID=10224 RepID=A0ABM0MXV0_SACKO|nr:PREDICTED: MAPK/MAK/MRK overlapping kinase-like [Saccoglossus kowalevskii]
MQKYRILGKKGEGTFSEVLKCQNIKDGQYYACKKMKQHYDSLEHVNNLREIQAMRRLSPHQNILELREVIFDKKSGTLALICELMDMNIYELIRGRRHYLPEQKIKNYMYQLLKSVDHMHRNGIFHRDVKPENILIKDEVLKLADFGSCRSVYSKPPYTEYISTRWYRAPECLLTDGYYSYKMDLWSVGCVIFEVMSLHPLFPGSNEVDQIAKIHDIMGTPDNTVLNKLRNKNRGMNFNFPQKSGSGIERLLPHASKECMDLIYQLCTYDPDERISAKQAIRHPYFKDLRDAEKRVQAMAKLPSKVDESNKDRPNSANTDIPKSHMSKDLPLNARHRRRRRQKKLSDVDNVQHSSLFPKVSQAATLHSTTFPTASFPATFPKLHHHHMLPSIANSHYNKHHHHHHHHHKKSTYDSHTKNMYGHYQLPSIDRSGKGGF